MGRKRIEKLRRLEADHQRKVTLIKRQKNIIKKSIELSLLCDVSMFVFVYDQNSKSMVHYASHEKDDFMKMFDSDQFQKQYYTNQDYVQLGGRKQDLDGQYDFDENDCLKPISSLSELDVIQPNTQMAQNDLANLSIESKQDIQQKKSQKNSISQCFKQIEKLIQKSKDYEKKLMMQSVNLENDPLAHPIHVERFKSITNQSDPTGIQDPNTDNSQMHTQPLPILELQNARERQIKGNIIDIESQQDKLNNKMKSMTQSPNFCDKFFLKKRHHQDRNRYSSPRVHLNNANNNQKNHDKIFDDERNQKDREYDEGPRHHKYQRRNKLRNLERVPAPETPLTNQFIQQGFFLQPMMFEPVPQMNMMQPFQFHRTQNGQMGFIPQPMRMNQMNLYQNQTWNYKNSRQRKESIYTDDNKAPIITQKRKFKERDHSKQHPRIDINDVELDQDSMRSDMSGKLSSIKPIK